jgi:hypothetical protein
MSQENPVFQVEGIISITGKSEVFKIVARSRNGLIAEKLDKSKKFPVSATHGVSALAEIAIYSFNEEVPLKQVMGNLYVKLNGEPAPKSSADESTLRDLFSEILPDYDQERVYLSDIKKVYNWYNQLIAAGYQLEAEKTADSTATESGEDSSAAEAPTE